MSLPERLIIHNFAYALDGGTISLLTRDQAGRDHSIMLVQHAFPQPSSSVGPTPGRLYFDGRLVPMRSELEAGLLALLRAAEVRYTAHPEQSERLQSAPNALILGEDIRQVLTRGPEENIRELTAELIRFVESDEYLQFAERVEQAADPTLYDVWVAWDRISRNRVIVRLGRVLGIGIQAARDLLDRGVPLAQGISALEVSELGERCAAEGLELRVVPEFRWRLV